MLAAITLYMSVIYGVLYLSFVAWPLIYQGGHHFAAGFSGLMVRPRRFLFSTAFLFPLADILPPFPSVVPSIPLWERSWNWALCSLLQSEVYQRFR